MLLVTVYDTKPHDRQYLEDGYGSKTIALRFFLDRLLLIFYQSK